MNASFRRNQSAIALALAALLTAILLFVVIPIWSARLHGEYNQDVYADGYDQLADNLATGHGYRFYPDTAATLMREPGYPLVLAGIFLVFGKSFAAVKAVNLVLALGAAWLMMGLAKKFSIHPLLTIAPPLLFLFHPATLVAESRGGVEILFTFLIVLFLRLVYRAIESRGWWAYAAGGAVLGLAVLVRSTPMLFPAFLLVYLIAIEKQKMTAAAGRVAVMIAAMLMVMSPWIVRNYSLTGKFVPTASVLGTSAHAGEYICAHRGENRPMWLLDREAAHQRADLAHGLGLRFRDDFYYQMFYAPGDELVFSNYLLHRVEDEYKTSPLLCVRCMSANLVYFWIAGKTEGATLANAAVQLPYLVLGIAGVVLCVRNAQFKMIAPMLLFIGYVMSVYVPILAQARYSVPLLPFVSILAGVALMAAQRRFAERHAVEPMRTSAEARMLPFVRHQEERR